VGGRPLVPLFLTVLVDVLALTIMLPLLPHMAEHYGASAFVATTLFACYSACQFVSGPVLGAVSDRVGRKPTLLVSQFGTFAGLLVLAFTNRLELMFVARIIDGLTAGNLSIAQAYITDVTRPEDRTRAFGLIGIAFGIGFLFGPGVSGLLGKLDFHYPPMLAAALSLLSVILTATLLPAIPGKARAKVTRSELFRRYMGNALTRGRLLEMFCFTFSFSTLTSGLALMLAGRFHYGVLGAALVFAYSGVIGGSVQGGLGRLSRAVGEARLSMAALGMMIVGYVLLALATSLPMLLVAIAVGALGSAVARPSLTTLLTRTVSDHEQGLALGINQSLGSIAMTCAPLVGGLLIQRGALAAWALVAAAFAGFALVVRRTLPLAGKPAGAAAAGG
jgi:MFS family permease